MSGKEKKEEAIRVNVTASQRERLEREAVTQDRSIAAVVRRAIDYYLDRKGAPE